MIMFIILNDWTLSNVNISNNDKVDLDPVEIAEDLQVPVL